MRTLARVLTPIGFFVGIAVGVNAVVLSMELEKFRHAGDADVRPVTAAELVRDGAGKNGHVVISDFRFGEPKLEKEGEGWQRYSVPVLPIKEVKEDAKNAANILVLRVDVEDRAELDELQKQDSLEVVAMRAPVPKVAPAKSQKAAPRTEPNPGQPKTIVLRSARLALAGVTILEGEALFDGKYGIISWVAAAVAFALVFVSIYWAWSIPARPSRLAREDQAARDELLTQYPISEHQFLFWRYFTATWQFYVALVPFGLAIGGLGRGFDLLADPTATGQATPNAVFTSISLLLTWACIAGAFRQRWTSPAEVLVCHDGLRWRIGNLWDCALWSDVKSVSRGETVVMRRGQAVGHTGITAVVLKDGRELRFQPNRYSDYNALANQVQTAAGAAIVQEKGKELASTGTVEFGPIAVSPEAFIIKGWVFNQSIAWDNIERFKIVNGYLVIFLRNTWFVRSTSVPLASIPDYLALLALLQSYGRQSLDESLKHGIPAGS